MVDPQHAAVYHYILTKAQQLGDRRLELIVRRKLQPAHPRPQERIYSTPTGCVVIDFPAPVQPPGRSPKKQRHMWLTILGCLVVYPGSFLALLMLSAYLT